MNERTKTGLEIIEAAVLLGVLGDAFLRATPWGLNVFLFVGALCRGDADAGFAAQTRILECSNRIFARRSDFLCGDVRLARFD